ncbi:MAG: metallophosphoesterase, partial [Clostridia bacterium]|nr:metallophosphoesterase [Clostridia bacterium]
MNTNKQNKIFVIGDTHGTRDIKKLKTLCQSEGLTYQDYVIIAGDAGIVWQDITSEHIEEYEKLGTNILFVDGNHEDFFSLSSYPVKHWKGGKIHRISTHIIHLMRGQIFN